MGKRRVAQKGATMGTITEADYFAKLSKETNDNHDLQRGTALAVVLDRGRIQSTKAIEVWKAHYTLSTLPGWHGLAVPVLATVQREGMDVVSYRMAAPGHIFIFGGIWDFVEVLHWLGLGMTDDPIWRRDREQEELVRVANEGMKQHGKTGIMVPTGPIRIQPQHD